MIIFHLTKRYNLRVNQPAVYSVNNPIITQQLNEQYLPFRGTSQQLTELLFNKAITCGLQEGNPSMSFKWEALPGGGRSGFSASWDGPHQAWGTQLASLKETMCFVARRQPGALLWGCLFRKRQGTEPKAVYRVNPKARD